MTAQHTQFHSVNGRRRILVVEDERINREVLGGILEDEYEVLFAEDGPEALQIIAENSDTLSVVLLDLIMPKMPGLEVLKVIKTDYRQIPVIVASGDQSQEIDCLIAGATDFIQKPYPDPGVIRARVLRTIELNEDKQIIRSTERDPLTGLYNREYFLSYAEQLDQFNKDVDMDAIVIDIGRFSMINERYGREFANELLRRVSERIREAVEPSGGIVCRHQADTFLVYGPHRDDYKAILDSATVGISEEQPDNRRIRLRMGVYSSVDKSVEMERRFDRAKTAADSVRTSYTRNIGVYDDSLRKSELYSEQLIEDFHTAIAEHQFKVYFQPKYDIRGEKPRLSGAEGLVRWQHPELGLVSPGVFIPLFEANGLIQALDVYVWREAAAQIRRWKDQYGLSVPVSVNASRVDMSDPGTVYTLQEIVEQNGISPGDIRMEVTESAYTEDSEQIIEMVKKLQLMGHSIEMDDFGTGYSSLNMLSEMPMDALKLDMKFIRTAFAGEKDTHMLEVVIGIADHLHVPVIAEGVETEEQLKTLREIGCDYVQGYYFSPPVPSEQFEALLKNSAAEEEEAAGETAATSQAPSLWDRFIARLTPKGSISLGRASIMFLTVSAVLAVLLFGADTLVTQSYLRNERLNERFSSAQQAATNLMTASDYLTDRVRSFVVTGNVDDLMDYFQEVEVTQRRDAAVATIEALYEDQDNVAYGHLATALNYSNELMDYEYRAMRLVLDTISVDEAHLARIPEAVKSYDLGDDGALDDAAKRTRAADLVFGSEYMWYKERIQEETERCTEVLIDEAGRDRTNSAGQTRMLLSLQTVLTVMFLVVILAIVVFLMVWVKKPLEQMVRQMRAKKDAPAEGAQELQFVAQTYNEINESNRKAHERVTYSATHDALTGMLNRSAYDIMRQNMDVGQTALLLVDVDKFKSINDTYGHTVGDLVLKNVASLLSNSFRPTDMVFRLGGDEFVVIMAPADSSMGDEVKARIEQINVMLQQPSDDLPPTSLSVGVAFSDRPNPEGDIFKDADTALYRVKNAGRCGCAVY